MPTSDDDLEILAEEAEEEDTSPEDNDADEPVVEKEEEDEEEALVPVNKAEKANAKQKKVKAANGKPKDKAKASAKQKVKAKTSAKQKKRKSTDDDANPAPLKKKKIANKAEEKEDEEATPATAKATAKTNEEKEDGQIDEEATPLPPYLVAKRAAAKATAKATAKAQQEQKEASNLEEVLQDVVGMTIASSASATQRTGKYRFHVKMAQPTSFRQLTSIIRDLTEEITFDVVGANKPNDFQGIKFNAWVGGKTCYTSGSHTLDVQDISPVDAKSNITSFSVKLADFATCVKQIPASAVTEIYQGINEDPIHIDAVDAVSGREQRLTVPTILTQASETNVLDDKLFQFTVEFSLAELDRICRSAVTLGADVISFVLLKSPTTGDIVVKVATKGRVEFSEFFPSMSGASGTIRVGNNRATTFDAEEEEEAGENSKKKKKQEQERTRHDYVKYDTILDDGFNIKSLMAFVKNLEKNTIMIYFAPEVCMCLHYSFGNSFSNEHNSIRYIIAANVKEDN